MKVGDVVIPKSGEFVLHCGSGCYTHAICVSVAPFVLVSEEGDMRWSATVEKENFVALCQASEEIVERCKTRAIRDGMKIKETKSKKMVGPIKPSEVSKKKIETTPSEVFDAFNTLIAQDWNGHSATVMQGEVVRLIQQKLKAAGKRTTREQMAKKGWLDVEDSYRKEGWTVTYDKPGFNETYYEPSFRFSKRA